ncbi:hypothetical protein [Sporosarcina ureae]|uniref:hypothetical protein n=1 Tax=Sporosarcina ureae TaxID=1571 RepID=UPI0028AF4090|nr:hypothetical protein [Sporosarcina ureae]
MEKDYLLRNLKAGAGLFRGIVSQAGKCTALHNLDMKARYRMMKEQGKLTGQAYIAIGNRIVRLAYAMRRHQTLCQSICPDHILQ